MRLRTVAGAAAAGAGALAASNWLLARRAGSLPAPLPGEERTHRWRGFDVGYTEAGDPADPDLLLVHGVNAAASSHEFAEVVERLAEEYHVVAPDLPGFGRTDRPPLLYSGSLYATFLADFAEDVVDEPVCVASSLSASYAAIAAESIPVERLVLVCPTATTMPGRRVWLRSLVRSPLVGQAVFNGLASKPSIRHFDRDHGYADPARMTEETVDYEWTTAHQPGARFAPASFVSGFLDPDVDLAETLAGLDVPVTLVWGREADITPLDRGEELATAADARLVVFDDAKLLPHVEHPARFADVVAGRVEGE